VATLSVSQLMWLQFKRNRLAIIGGVLLGIMYFMALFAGFLAPYGVRTTHEKYTSAPPHLFRFIDAEGNFHLRPFVYGLRQDVDPKTFARTYTPITDEIYPVRLFVKGTPYKLFGLIPAERHLFLVDEPGKIFLCGTDRNGRDLFTRILYGSQVSLTVGLVGVLMSLIIGSFVGVMSGYYGGVIDNIAQRSIEVLMSFPRIPLWLALASALPPNWSSIKVYFGISLVLSFVNWGGLARQVRGKVLALRENDFVIAAHYANCSDLRVIIRHLFPNTFSHVLVVATMSIPNMILGETSLSFLGLGIQAPMTSWGVLLSDAQSVRVFLQQPWLLLPALFVMATIVSFNFVGDGLRDAADPFASA
jgi:peptide/nickel transport system permease protein